MCLELDARAEVLRTHLALERVLAGVRVQVHGVVVAYLEALVADGAPEWRVGAVYGHVTLQVLVLIETFAADVTLVLPGSEVNYIMLGQINAQFESFSANRTHVVATPTVPN